MKPMFLVIYQITHWAENHDYVENKCYHLYTDKTYAYNLCHSLRAISRFIKESRSEYHAWKQDFYKTHPYHGGYSFMEDWWKEKLASKALDTHFFALKDFDIICPRYNGDYEIAEFPDDFDVNEFDLNGKSRRL